MHITFRAFIIYHRLRVMAHTDHIAEYVPPVGTIPSTHPHVLSLLKEILQHNQLSVPSTIHFDH